jgi:hypothetical protein
MLNGELVFIAAIIVIIIGIVVVAFMLPGKKK